MFLRLNAQACIKLIISFPHFLYFISGSSCLFFLTICSMCICSEIDISFGAKHSNRANKMSCSFPLRFTCCSIVAILFMLGVHGGRAYPRITRALGKMSYQKSITFSPYFVIPFFIDHLPITRQFLQFFCLVN